MYYISWRPPHMRGPSISAYPSREVRDAMQSVLLREGFIFCCWDTIPVALNA